jgi:molybdopterin/thiamine biosynthesis adenylyltransferase
MHEPAMNFSAQHGLFDPTMDEPVTVIGAGSIGSHVVLGLAKQGVKRIAVYDDDFVESHNCPASVYSPNDLARNKLEALRDDVERASGLRIEIRPRRYDGTEPLMGTVVCCVDDMDQRLIVWKQVKLQPAVRLFVDTRVNQEHVSVFSIDPNEPDDIEFYGHFLYGREEAEPTLCGGHGIWYVSVRTAGAVCANLTQWWTSGSKKRHHEELTGALENID